MHRTSAKKLYFTSYLLRKGLECPAKLFYKAHAYPEDDAILPFLRHAGFNKYWLQQLASCFYPEGQKVDEPTTEKALEKTKEYLKQEAIVLFGAVFSYQQLLVKVPALIKKGQHIQLVRVQVKGFNPAKNRVQTQSGQLHTKWKPYILDQAYQAYIIGRVYPQWQLDSRMWLPNKTAAFCEHDLLQKLKETRDETAPIPKESVFCKIDLNTPVTALLEGTTEDTFLGDHSFVEAIKILSKRYFDARWQEVAIGAKCKNCEYRIAPHKVEQGAQSGFNRCWSQESQVSGFTPSRPHVFDLIGPGVQQWVEEGIYFQEQIPTNSLSVLKTLEHSKKAITQKQRQALQVQQAKKQEVPTEIIKPQIFTELERWNYPIHFLDFEAGNYAIPLRNNRKPYHLVVFQFSCHSLQKNGTLAHHQWIAKQLQPYPNYELVRQLMNVPALEQGTIVQYSNFERRALKTIRKELMDDYDQVHDAHTLIGWLEHNLQRKESHLRKPPYMVDLSRLVKNYYYNCAMGGSLSIKDVVQAILTISEPLKKLYSLPYKSSNFENICWWQWDEQHQQALNPYDILRKTQQEETIGRGTEAMLAFGKMAAGEWPTASKKQVLKALLKYCELDTLAMVMIFQHWKHSKKCYLLE